MRFIVYILICSLIGTNVLYAEGIYFENYAFKLKKLEGFSEVEYKDNTSNQVLLYLKKSGAESYEDFPTINIIKIPGGSAIHTGQNYLNTKRSVDIIWQSYQLSGLNIKDAKIYSSDLWPQEKVFAVLLTYENKANEFKALSITIEGIEEHYIVTMITKESDPDLPKYLESIKESLIIKYEAKKDVPNEVSNIVFYICFIALFLLALLYVKKIINKP
jgi:hypothetical protein